MPLMLARSARSHEVLSRSPDASPTEQQHNDQDQQDYPDAAEAAGAIIATPIAIVPAAHAEQDDDYHQEQEQIHRMPGPMMAKPNTAQPNRKNNIKPTNHPPRFQYGWPCGVKLPKAQKMIQMIIMSQNRNPIVMSPAS
jgi:hypothetical protein